MPELTQRERLRVSTRTASIMDVSEPLHSSDLRPKLLASRKSKIAQKQHGLDGQTREAFVQRLGEIFAETESLDAKRVLDNGGYVITAKQFRLLEWAERQLQILRLEKQCEGILEELAHEEAVEHEG